jgi:hypothetical protein
MLQQCCVDKVACAYLAACQDFVHAAAYGGDTGVFAAIFSRMSKTAVCCTIKVQKYAQDVKIKGEKRREKKGTQGKKWRLAHATPAFYLFRLPPLLLSAFPLSLSPAFTRHHGTFRPCATLCWAQHTVESRFES